MRNASGSLSGEIEAMAAIGRALDGLTDSSARQRVLKWAIERFGADQPTISVATDQGAVVAGAPVATDSDLTVDSLNDMFAIAVQDVDDDLGEFAAVPVPAEAQPAEAVQKLPLETLLRSLAADFRAFADEWNGAAA